MLEQLGGRVGRKARGGAGRAQVEGEPRVGAAV